MNKHNLVLLKEYLCDSGYPALALRPRQFLLAALEEAKQDILAAGQSLMDKSRHRPDTHPRDDGDLQAQPLYDPGEDALGLTTEDTPSPQ
jgi:hypothetical protein